jgi:hypothetical protein
VHDFLLAAMIVYMSILQSSSEYRDDFQTDTASETRRRMVNALEQSHTIWKCGWIVSTESKRAAAVLAVMLKKINNEHDSIQGFSSAPETAKQGQAMTVSDLSLNGMFCNLSLFGNETELF